MFYLGIILVIVTNILNLIQNILILYLSIWIKLTSVSKCFHYTNNITQGFFFYRKSLFQIIRNNRMRTIYAPLNTQNWTIRLLLNLWIFIFLKYLSLYVYFTVEVEIKFSTKRNSQQSKQPYFIWLSSLGILFRNDCEIRNAWGYFIVSCSAIVERSVYQSKFFHLLNFVKSFITQQASTTNNTDFILDSLDISIF